METLSDKKCIIKGYEEDVLFHKDDVKELIKNLKECYIAQTLTISKIDKLIGDDLK